MDFLNIEQESLYIGLMALLLAVACALLMMANLTIYSKNSHLANLEEENKLLTEKHSAEIKELNRKILKRSLGDTLKRLSSKDEGSFVDMDEVSNLTKMAITFGYNKGSEDTAKGTQVSSDDSAEHYYNEFISGLIK
ncbi:hypothetical protein ACYVOU_002409 [Vibrio cholerae]|nr:hypothetical protein [Vibrio cholerae]